MDLIATQREELKQKERILTEPRMTLWLSLFIERRVTNFDTLDQDTRRARERKDRISKI